MASGRVPADVDRNQTCVILKLHNNASLFRIANLIHLCHNPVRQSFFGDGYNSCDQIVIYKRILYLKPPVHTHRRPIQIQLICVFLQLQSADKILFPPERARLPHYIHLPLTDLSVRPDVLPCIHTQTGWSVNEHHLQ